MIRARDQNFYNSCADSVFLFLSEKYECKIPLTVPNTTIEMDRVMSTPLSTGTLFLVATPIGNLGDISARAVEVLQTVDTIACEDTRVFGKLAQRWKIHTPKISYHQHSSPERVLSLLTSGKNIAFVSDAGTPGISDPGTLLSALAIEKNIVVVPVPGASAVITALCASGLPTNHFEFFGFVPHKKGRQTFFKNLNTLSHTAIFYESSHRIEKCLAQLIEFAPEKKVVVAKELTKIHENFFRGSAEKIAQQLRKTPAFTKGEFVVLVF